MSFEAGNNEIIDGIPPEIANQSGSVTDTGPKFEYPEGSEVTGEGTQPDYAAFAREATRVALATNGLGATGELGDVYPRDDSGRRAKETPIVYGKAPDVPEGTRVIEAQ